MSNFDFLKKFSEELYRIGVKLEDDVLESPRAATVDATQFLETLVMDIYKRSNKKMITTLPFYKKVEYLYRTNVISYSFKNRLLDAYSLRNKIHAQFENRTEETAIALDLHQKLFYLSKRYYLDFHDRNGEYVLIPSYSSPNIESFNFETCIICGSEDKDYSSNFCHKCNGKIEKANYFLSIKNTFQDEFSKNDLIDYGISESEAISLIMDLTKENLIEMKGKTFYFNEKSFEDYIAEIDSYLEIGILLNQFYKNEISPIEIKNTLEYSNGFRGVESYAEFYRLTNQKIEHDFENMIVTCGNIKKSMKEVGYEKSDIGEWYKKQKELYLNGTANEPFIMFNEILKDEYLSLKRRGMDEHPVRCELNITNEMHKFWTDCIFKDELIEDIRNIQKELLIKELKNDGSLNEALKSSGLTKSEFNEIYEVSRKKKDKFYTDFREFYIKKRQRIFLKHIKKNNLDRAIKKSKITKKQFLKWYFEDNNSKFYMKTTKILMKRYLKYRESGKNKKDILSIMGLDKKIFKSWDRDDGRMFIQFRNKNLKITSNLIKRGLIINALKEDKNKLEAIESAGLTIEEFEEIYKRSKKEKSNFYLRFDEEYTENRKRLFIRNLKGNDFYNAIEKSEITQKEFLNWYLKEQLTFSEFYMKTTELLMDKYLEARKDGLNKPDASRRVGLSNVIVDRWMKYHDVPFYKSFIDKIDMMTFDFILNGFRNAQSKEEVSKCHDISMKTIEKYINLGKNGFKPYDEIFHVYEKVVIPNQLSIFLNDISNKPFKKSLRHSKMSEDDFNHYYNLGKSGNEKFKSFHDDYLKLKIEIYVDSILSKKSSKIALKNSNLTGDELDANRKDIDEKILDGRLEILCDELSKNKTSSSRLATLSGLSVEEIYEWFFMGKNGNSKFEEFSLLFDLNIVIPRTLTIHGALLSGIPKNRLMNKLKKDIGTKDFNIWKNHGLIERDDADIILENDNIDKKRVMALIQSANHLNGITREDDPEIHAFLMRIAETRRNIVFPQKVSSHKNRELMEEIIGK